MTKSELRALIAQQVAALPPDYCREADGAICRHVLDWEVYRQAKAVFCYVGTDREIDTRPILRDALDRGKVLAVPLCVAKGVMEARQIRSLDDLVPGKYGIVTRPNFVTVRAQDRNGAWFEAEGEALIARCFCHELAHLDGQLYTEIAERMLTAEELRAMEEEEA